MKVLKYLPFAFVLFFMACDTTEETPASGFQDPPGDFRLVTLGTVDMNGDTTAVTQFNYDASGRYIDNAIVYENDLVMRSQRPYRGGFADYFYGSNTLLDSVVTGAGYSTFESRNSLPYYIVGTFEYESNQRLAAATFKTFPPTDINVDGSYQFAYSGNTITVTPNQGEPTEYTFREEFNPLPIGFRLSRDWGATWWGYRDWPGYLSPNLLLSAKTGSAIETFDGYTFNSYGYPTRRDHEEGHSFFIYNY